MPRRDAPAPAAPAAAPEEREALSGLGYAEAVRELEEILGRIEVADVDVDALGADVARAALLLQHCRGRIARAETRIRDVLAELDAPGAAAPAKAED
jgi:exodeoxyribonuclease VII small subunit